VGSSLVSVDALDGCGRSATTLTTSEVADVEDTADTAADGAGSDPFASRVEDAAGVSTAGVVGVVAADSAGALDSVGWSDSETTSEPLTTSCAVAAGAVGTSDASELADTSAPSVTSFSVGVWVDGEVASGGSVASSVLVVAPVDGPASVEVWLDASSPEAVEVSLVELRVDPVVDSPRGVGPAVDAESDDCEVELPESAFAAPGEVTIISPTPRAAAKAPTRPMGPPRIVALRVGVNGELTGRWFAVMA